MIKKHIKLIIFLILIIFLVFTSYHFENKVFSPHFVDEDDNFVLGKYLLEGETLYSDLFSHHQQLAYIFSAGIQQVTDPNSIYLLVKRHREFIILWSAIWCLLLYLRIGLPALLFIIPFELTKIFFFGNLFLSESLAVYPFIYITSQIFFKQNGYSKLELGILGFCFSLVVFLLAPLWPVLILEFLIIIWRIKNQFKKLIVLILGALPLTIISAYFSSLTEYINLVFRINFSYYIPMTSQDPLSRKILMAFLMPIFSLIPKSEHSDGLIFIQMVSLILILSSTFFLIRKQFSAVLLVFTLLGLANLRYSDIGAQYYSGFHQLPWIGILLLSISYLVWIILKNKHTLINKSFLTVITIILFFGLIGGYKELTTRHDIERDFYVNFSRQFDAGEIVRIMKADNDSLMVVPDEWLVYWQADINHHTRMLNYYAWMTEVPGLNQTVERGFRNNPPAFFYCDCPKGYFGLEEYFDLYQPVIKDDEKIKLLVRKDKVKQVSEEQKQKLQFYNVSFD